MYRIEIVELTRNENENNRIDSRVVLLQEKTEINLDAIIVAVNTAPVVKRVRKSRAKASV
jgi:hypothetical protein